jgi:tRNA threonylcarbamoyladenosine biosynthesis protein TsaE
MNGFTFTAVNEQDTVRLGRALAEILPDGTVVALCGPLGSGKTRLVQAFAEARGVAREEVTSPTFVLLQHYGSRERPIHHFDVYRVADEDEFLQLGPEEYFESTGVTFIEWADRVASLLPSEHLKIDIAIQSPIARRFEVSFVGPGLAEALALLGKALQTPKAARRAADPSRAKKSAS